MKKESLRRIESGDEFVALLKKHNLFRDDDVTFDDLGENMYRYDGDDFSVDAELFEELEISALLVEGNIRSDFVSVGQILPDYGVFCVTGNVRVHDMLYMTESTGLVVGGNLDVDNIFFADCGNSLLQVNGDLTAKLLFNGQCSVEVLGKETFTFDEGIEADGLRSLGIDAAGLEPAEAVRAYFEKYEAAE